MIRLVWHSDRLCCSACFRPAISSAGFTGSISATTEAETRATTNMIRTLGTKAGLITFAGDCLKSIFAVLLVRAPVRTDLRDIMPLLSFYAGAGVIIAHNFPFYLNFKGGKGSRRPRAWSWPSIRGLPSLRPYNSHRTGILPAGIRRDEICIRGIPDVLRGLFPHDSDHGDDRSFPHDLLASDGAVRRSFCPDRAVLVAAPGEHLPADRRHREQDSSVQEPLMLKTETGYREPQAASGC